MGKRALSRKLKAREGGPTNLQRAKLSKRRDFKARTSALKNIKVTQALSYEVNWLSKQKREAKRESKGIKTPPPNLKLVRFIDFRAQEAQQRATILSMSTKS